MQNVLAAENEGLTLKNTYINTNSMSSKHTFIIPVYENMPTKQCSRPSTTEASNTTMDLVKVNAEGGLRLRKSANGESTGIYLNKNEIVTRIEKATSKVGGTYWDKILKSDGTVGYAARETYESEANYKLYLVPIKGVDEIEEAEYKLGDCNNDGVINSGDLLILKKHLIGTSVATDAKVLKAMDVNKDGSINSGDLLLIRKSLLGTYIIE